MNDSSPRVFSPLAARIYGVITIVAPLLLLGSTVAYLVDGEGINDGVLGGTVGVWSALAFVIAFAGILRLLEVRAPRAAPILAIFALAGFSGGIAFNLDAIFTALLGPDGNAAVDTAFDEGGNAIGLLAFQPWGWFAPLSLVLVGIFLWRTRTTAWWTGALMIVGGVLFLVSRAGEVDPLVPVGDVALILALVPVGWAILTRARSATTAPGSHTG